jgi:plastocyanin
MTWLSRTFSSLVWLIVCLPLAAHAGAVAGNIKLVNSRDPEVRKHMDFSGVVVWLEPAGHAPAPAVPNLNHPTVMAQKMKTFTPHVLAIPAGSQVAFPNFDPIFHNAFSSFSGQIFDVGLYPPGHSRSVTFKRQGVVRVFCNIHPTMSAVIVVLNTPWFAVSDKSGSFTIPHVPAGEYLLHVYHERALQQTLDRIDQTVRVTAEGLDIPLLVISETGYVQAPHQNKHDMDYPSASDQLLYTGDGK